MWWKREWHVIEGSRNSQLRALTTHPIFRQKHAIEVMEWGYRKPRGVTVLIKGRVHTGSREVRQREAQLDRRPVPLTSQHKTICIVRRYQWLFKNTSHSLIMTVRDPIGYWPRLASGKVWRHEIVRDSASLTVITIWQPSSESTHDCWAT